jgi:sirohydrochlorin ferrochelatase
LADRLGAVGPDDAVVLAGAGSSRPEAADELAEMARLLGARLGRKVSLVTLGENVRAVFRALSRPIRVATYLIAEGQFVTALNAAAAGLGEVAPPIGVHPALVRLAWQRYTELDAPA